MIQEKEVSKASKEFKVQKEKKVILVFKVKEVHKVSKELED